MVAFQNDDYHYYFGVKRTGGVLQLFLEKADGGDPVVVHLKGYSTGQKSIQLGIEGNNSIINFYYLADNGDKIYFASADATLLSTETAGGFVGAHVGIHARREQ
jgi:xylan 1,4-beta-xylosidase